MVALLRTQPSQQLGAPWPSAPPTPAPGPTTAPWVPFNGNGGGSPTPYYPNTPDPQYNDPTPQYPQYPGPPRQPATGSSWLSRPFDPSRVATGGNNSLPWWPQSGANGYGDPNQTGFNARQRIFDARGVALGADTNVLAARRGVTAATGGVLGARGLTLDAQGRVLDARGRSLDAQGNVINAQRNLIAPETAVLDQRGNVLRMRQGVNQQTGAYIAQTGAEIEQQRKEEQQRQAAVGNVQDITATAREQQSRQSEDQRDAALGVAAPIDVTVPAGTTGLPGGVRAAVRTQGDYVTESNTNARTLRGFNLQAAHNAILSSSNDADAAQLVADKLGLDLDHAQLLVEQARNEAASAGLNESGAQLGASRAGLNESGAQLNESYAGLGLSNAQNESSAAGINENYAQLGYEQSQNPPAPGYQIYTDPNTGRGSWVTPEVFQQNRYRDLYGPNGIYSQRLATGETAGQVRAAGPQEIGNASLPSLRSWLSQGLITETEMRAILGSRGVDPNRIEIEIRDAANNRRQVGGVAE